MPDLTLEDSKLSYTVADFKTEFYPHLSPADKRLVDLFYLKHDNANVLKLLRDKDAHLDTCGNYSPDTLAEYIAALKDGDHLPDSVFPSYLSTFITEHFSQSVEGANQLPEDRLASLYYAYAMRCKNRFVSRWFEFNLARGNYTPVEFFSPVHPDGSLLQAWSGVGALALRHPSGDFFRKKLN